MQGKSDCTKSGIFHFAPAGVVLGALGGMLTTALQAADSGPMRLESQGGRVIATCPSGNFRVVTNGVEISRAQWKNALDYLDDVSVSLRLRWGHMYDLYELNQPTAHHELSRGVATIEGEGSEAAVVGVASGPGIELTGETRFDAAANRIDVTLVLRRTQGERPSKFQLLLRGERPGVSLA